MRIHLFSTIFGLTIGFVGISPPIQAATFNYEQLKNISS